MMTDSSSQLATSGNVLIAEDEQDVADLYRLWLSEHYDVRVVHDGEAAIDVFDNTIDVALLDRRMPNRSGDAVLDHIRTEGFDCHVALMTAIDPTPEILEMPIDEYLCKPIDREELVATVTELLFRMDVTPIKQELLALMSRKHTLDDAVQTVDSTSNSAYHDLETRIERIMTRLSDQRATTTSGYHHETCPGCDLEWYRSDSDLVGFVELDETVVKCLHCGELNTRPSITKQEGV